MPVEGKDKVIMGWVGLLSVATSTLEMYSFQYNGTLLPEGTALESFLESTPTPPIPTKAIQFVRQIELALE